MEEKLIPLGGSLFEDPDRSHQTPGLNPEETIPDKRHLRHPNFWLDWARKESAGGHKLSALLVLINGLHYTANEPRLRAEVERLGWRRKPPLSFLSRRNPLNRILGRARHRVFGPKRLFMGVQRLSDDSGKRS